MQYPVAVQVLDGGRELEQQGLDLRGEEWFGHVFLEGFEVVFEEVHDQEYTGLEDQLRGLDCVSTRPKFR